MDLTEKYPITVKMNEKRWSNGQSLLPLKKFFKKLECCCSCYTVFVFPLENLFSLLDLVIRTVANVRVHYNYSKKIFQSPTISEYEIQFLVLLSCLKENWRWIFIQ